MIPFTDYARISNNYCLCYFGRSTEYLLQLIYLMPYIQDRLSGLNIYLCAKDEDFHIIELYPLSIKRSELNDYKPLLGYIKELVYENIHPIQGIINELDIKNYVVQNQCNSRSISKCYIAKHSHYPTKDLNNQQIEHIKKMIANEGYEITDTCDFDWIIGVECPLLYKSAESSIRSTLIDNGLGSKLFKNMFPFCDIKSI